MDSIPALPSNLKTTTTIRLLVGCLLSSLLILAGCGPSSQTETNALERIQSQGVLHAGVKYDAKPFGYLDTDGQVKGFDIDLLKELARRISTDENNPIDVSFEQVLSSTRVMGLNLGKLDVVAATMTITPEREETVDFSDVYYTAHQSVLVRANSPIKHLNDLHEKTILYVIGSTSETHIKNALPQSRFLGFKTAVDGFSALKSGRGNAFTSDNTLLYGFMSESCQFRLLPEVLSSEPYGLALRQDNTNHSTDSLREAINSALKAMKEDGTLARLEKKWITPYEDNASCPGKGKRTSNTASPSNADNNPDNENPSGQEPVL